ncbi:hypothetical protein BCR36DRAFT_585611 [Piromyces finnis]|uniref:F-box domain-containing protein n=1 Tax=Piromyces finnis TaxID=1754191 RepID=A0A1Y1V4A3_9FUNG|nr:hypothetical protein BCR36DRAFT_585611 [Piromyces finnis]|eukprot:ORX45592.1 hypothetical protein BCR36DRAFT_585611 [Piromyces finnis]
MEDNNKFSLKLDLDLGNDIELAKDLDFDNFKKQFLTDEPDDFLKNSPVSPIRTNFQNANINASQVKTPTSQKRTSSFVAISKYLNNRYSTDSNVSNKTDNNISSLLVKVGDFFSKKTTEKEVDDNKVFIPTSTSDMPSAVIMNILLNVKSSNDLYNAALVCKRWATIALPLLYSKVHIKTENNFKICLKMKKCNKVCQICTNNTFSPIPSKYRGLIQELIVSLTHIDRNKLNSSATPIVPLYKSNNKQRLSVQSTLSNSSYLSNSSSIRLNSNRRDSEISIGSTISTLSNSLCNFPINEEETITTTTESSSTLAQLEGSNTSSPTLSPDGNNNTNSSLSELINLQLNSTSAATSSNLNINTSVRAIKRSSLNNGNSSPRIQPGNSSFQMDPFFEEHIINCAIGGNLKVLKLVNISLPSLNAMLKYIPPKQLKHLEVTTIHKRMTLEIDSLLNYLRRCDALSYLGLGFCTDHCSCWYDDNAKSLVSRLVKSLPPNLKSIRFFCSNMIHRDTMMIISQKCPKLEKLDLTEAWFELEEKEEEEETSAMDESFEKVQEDTAVEESKIEDQKENLLNIMSIPTKKGFQFANLKYFGCRGSGSLTTTKTVLNLIRSAPKLCNLNLDSPNEMTSMTSTPPSSAAAGRRSISFNGNRNSVSGSGKSIITSSDLTLKLFETILTHGNTESWKTLFLGPHLRSCSLGNLHCIALFSHLEVLQLSWVATDTLLNEITEQCRNLKVLDISYSSVTDKGLRRTFIENGYGKHLEWLGIHSCNQITNEGKLLLVSEMPKLYGILTEKVALYWINNHFELRGWRGMNGYKQYIM